MANYASKDIAFLLIGGYSLLGVTTDIAFKRLKNILDDTTPLGVSNPTYAPVGLQRGDFSQKGFFDDAANGSNVALKGLAGTDRVGCFGIETNAVGKQFTGLAGALQADYERVMASAKLTRANAMYQVDGAIEEGVISHALGAETADGDTHATSVDASSGYPPITITSSSVANPTVITTAVPHGLTTGDIVVIAGHTGSTPAVSGSYTATVLTTTTFTVPVNVSVGGTGGTATKASSQNGGAVYIQATALTLGSATNLAVQVKDSADNITFAALSGAAFTVLTAAPAAERKAITGTIRRYTATYFAWTGGAGGGSTGTFMTGVVRS